MAEARIRLTGPWDRVLGSLDPKAWNTTLRKHVVKAHRLVGRAWQTTARRAIRRGDYAPNSPITVILKGSSTPLVADGDLFDAIGYQVASGGGGSTTTLRLGLVRGRQGATGERIDVAHILHEGATIDVGAKPQVRRKVWSMVGTALAASGDLNAAQRKSVLRAAGVLSQGGGARSIWVIPPRPFITRPAQDAGLQGYARKTYTRAVEVALRDHFPPSGGA